MTTLMMLTGGCGIFWQNSRLMAVLAVLSILILGFLLFAIDNLPAEYAQTYEANKPLIIAYELVIVLDIISLVMGIIYIAKGYSKPAAKYYKAFLLFTVLANAVSIIPGVMYRGFGGSFVFKLIKIVLLLVLFFYKDLGERNTWIVFALMLLADIIYTFFYDFTQEGASGVIALALSRLLSSGTIGLAIRGKYMDKKARGTK